LPPKSPNYPNSKLKRLQTPPTLDGGLMNVLHMMHATTVIALLRGQLASLTDGKSEDGDAATLPTSD
jgi:hypothetical protein